MINIIEIEKNEIDAVSGGNDVTAYGMGFIGSVAAVSLLFAHSIIHQAKDGTLQGWKGISSMLYIHSDQIPEVALANSILALSGFALGYIAVESLQTLWHNDLN